MRGADPGAAGLYRQPDCGVATTAFLLESVTDQYWLIDAGIAQPFDGDPPITALIVWPASRRRCVCAPAQAARKWDRKTQKRQEAEACQRLSEQKKPLLKRLTALERELTPLNAEKPRWTRNWADEAIYSAERKSEMQAALKRQGSQRPAGPSWKKTG